MLRLPLLALLLISTSASAQSPSSLFVDHEPITLELRGDIHDLLRDRGTQRKQHAARLRYAVSADTGSIDVKLRTRGIFRLRTCAFPPIRVDFPSHDVAGTPFAGQNRLKLATHCQGSGQFERNLLKEYALYRVFNALTDTSYRVRLARVTYVDSARADTVVRYGFLIESEGELARRVGAEVVEQGQVADYITEPSYMTLVAVFEYLIGNTDWSVWGRHNIAVLRGSAEPHSLIGVPYDYDFSGAVGAPYATPPPQVPIHSVRERYYRGYCQPDSVRDRALERFRLAKDSIYAAVRAVPGLPERDAKSVLDYFDGFFSNPGAVRRDLVQTCRHLPQ
ncbi:MAG TPA: hypothetical protein VL549_14500 [Gemmatimonadales bacterium]|jgi:hypothetical protein|nr:hypothetical protein [Gemmatimonadales bacterium]